MAREEKYSSYENVGEKNHFSKFYIDGKKQLCQLQKNNFIPRLCLKLTSSWGLEVKETSFSPWYMF
jgi:hypothetical protein